MENLKFREDFERDCEKRRLLCMKVNQMVEKGCDE
jgi:hypothetical protein